MKKFPIVALAAIFLLLQTFVACDTSSDTTDDSTARDCIISSATLGTLKRTMHTTNSAGEDSTYTVSVTGSLYPLYIDQVNYRVYNQDSLPVGTRTDKTVFTTLNYSSGITIRSLSTGNDSSFVYTDSTDFSVPRVLTVYSSDLSARRDYTIDIRVHKEEADTFVWQKILANPGSPIAAFTESRALSDGEQLYVLGKLSTGETQLVQTSTTAPSFDNATQMTTASGADLDVRSAQYFKDRFYALAGSKIVTAAAPSETWEDAGATEYFDALAGTSSDSLYAIAGGKMYASANGTDWTESAVDTPDSIPTTNISSAYHASRVDDTFETVVLVGYNSEDAPRVWKREIDMTGDFTFPWIYLPQTEELDDYGCPQLKGICLTAYDYATVLTGTTTSDNAVQLYLSSDNGRTWKTGEIDLPALNAATCVCATVDSGQYLWIVCSGSGEVYKGRYNRLGWDEEQTRFDRSVSR